MLKIRGVNQYYGGSHILRDVSVDLAQGSVTALIGRNGVGKTTLLNVITGQLTPRTGSLEIAGESLLGLAPERRAQLGIGYVPQGRMIFPALTVEENLRLALAARRDRVRRIPEAVYELFPVLASMRRRRGGDLSGGQQQQLAIGRALVQNPRLLLLDEPCEGIQPSIIDAIGEAVGRLNRELGITVLLVEQRLGFVRACADRFLIMERGSIRSQGAIDALDEPLIERYLAV